jgi:hypothetical protein
MSSYIRSPFKYVSLIVESNYIAFMIINIRALKLCEASMPKCIGLIKSRKGLHWVWIEAIGRG